ncbi:proline--tRNA ligase [Candidatus Woesearchaeota archaeon]|jgi:prolyl-tRNA synthetase|nr:proline--tRNA ligase [Candidatus Woesearchaeota archaeon]|tara:strand:+ start:1436 stop:2890 length:1455 start_codon:yes stop_codon:yes gene_type:complete
MAKKSKQEKGVNVKKKDDFSEWYTQVIRKAELMDYSVVSGCMVIRPYAYEMWEKIQSFIDKKIKTLGVKNAYFPLFIPESLLKKEKEHVEGFNPEVAWVTKTGNTKLSERLAIRPTSETIMYDSYKKWVRSYNDLPILINQWCNVVRWEFKHPMPFFRTREFLWQEGHTVHATKKQAEKEVLSILDIYTQVYEDLMAVPMLKGKKSEKEKFAGADYTLSVETFFPDGKAIQGATSHFLGQNFSKAFGIKFTDKDEKVRFAWQNSWGLTTRSIGVFLAIHGDDKGLIIPPKIAPVQVVIVPIIFEKTKNEVLKEAKKLKSELKSFSIKLDEREFYTPGWKFNHWEMKGVPLRIEIGPKDIEKKQVIVVRRDNSKKIVVKNKDLKKKIKELLDDIQKSLFNNAKKFLNNNIMEANNFNDFKKGIKNKNIVYAPWCGLKNCEELIKDKSGGAKSLNIPLNQKNLKSNNKCIQCNKDALFHAYFAKSY